MKVSGYVSVPNEIVSAMVAATEELSSVEVKDVYNKMLQIVRLGKPVFLSITKDDLKALPVPDAVLLDSNVTIPMTAIYSGDPGNVIISGGGYTLSASKSAPDTLNVVKAGT